MANSAAEEASEADASIKYGPCPLSEQALTALHNDCCRELSGWLACIFAQEAFAADRASRDLARRK